MRKFTIYNLQFTIVVLFCTLYILHSTFIHKVLALESTPSADIQTKLEELKKDIASKAAKLKGEINRKLTNKAYVGNVKTSSSNSLTLASSTGPKLVSINQDTIFESKVKGSLREERKKFSQKTLSEEDFLAALGDIDDTGVLTAKKIILLPTPKSSTKTYLWGQVVSISDRLITLKDRALKNIAVSFPSGTNVKLNDFIIATGQRGKNDIFEAEFVHIIQQGGILKPKKVASPSASIKPR